MKCFVACLKRKKNFKIAFSLSAVFAGVSLFLGGFVITSFFRGDLENIPSYVLISGGILSISPLAVAAISIYATCNIKAGIKETKRLLKEN